MAEKKKVMSNEFSQEVENRVRRYAIEKGVFNALIYGAAEEGIFECNVAEVGYERKTTFFSDFSIAEWYGGKSILETYESVCKEWISNHVFFTEFIWALNMKCWEWHARGFVELSQLYADLYYKSKDYAYEKWKNDKVALDYMFRTLD